MRKNYGLKSTKTYIFFNKFHNNHINFLYFNPKLKLSMHKKCLSISIKNLNEKFVYGYSYFDFKNGARFAKHRGYINLNKSKVIMLFLFYIYKPNEQYRRYLK